MDEILLAIERLRKAAIGEPVHMAEKAAFEYQAQSATVVAALKLVRAGHGLAAMQVLCSAGLFIDFGAIIRCVNDAVDEIYFLLEHYPNTSPLVDRFVKGFFETTIDGYLASEIPAVPSNKIRSATVRYLKGHADDRLTKIMTQIHKTFSGYVHAN